MARAQKPERLRLIGMLTTSNDPEMKAFEQQIEKRGWSEGRNIHIDHRHAPAGAQAQTLAKELVAMQPEVIFAMSRPATAALQKETSTIPIVFTYVIDPIGAGFIASLARPGGNITGLMAYDPSAVGKWLSMLKEIAPQTPRVGLLGNPKTAVYYDYLLGAAQAVARRYWGLKRSRAGSRMMRLISSARSRRLPACQIAAWWYCRKPPPAVNYKLIIALAARNRLPAVYTFKFIVRDGALMSYGIVSADHYRQAAYYVDRILRGAKQAELPVQTPTKYETALNLKTAKALGVTPPAGLLVAADEVIE